jgi:hypothetical protein
MKFKLNINLLFLLLVIGTLFSCKSSAPLPSSINTTRTITEIEVKHDTIFKVEADSSFYHAYLKCVNNKVVLDTTKPVTTSKPTNRIAVPKVALNNNQLQVDCEAKAQELLAEWKSKHKTETIETIIERPYPVERDLTFFQKLFIIAGKILLGAALIVGIGFILKLKKIISI